MSYFKDGKIIKVEPAPYKGYPGWELIDCGCCNGIIWGGEYPEECTECGASGFIAHHIKSDVFALYPGGQFI